MAVPKWCFGRFTLDPTRRGLYRDGARVHLTPKPFETLIYLVEHHGQTVGKQELLDAVWKDTAVTEDTLVQAVHEIRRVLEDDKIDPRFVQTVPRQGYRFVGDVRVEHEPEPARDAAVTPVGARRGADPVPDVARARHTWMWRTAVLVTLVVIAALLSAVASRRGLSGGPAAPAILEQLTPEGVSAGKPAYSPEGHILYNSGGALHIRLAGSDTSVRITDSILPSGDMPVFTADGARVVFSLPRSGESGSRVYDLYTVGSIGGSPELFIPEASGAGFSPDGRWVAYTKYLLGRPVLWISAVDRLERHVEVRPGGFVPRWSPDGRWLAYTTGDPNATSGELWMAAISPSPDGELQIADQIRLTNEPQPMYGLAWARDGRSIIFAARRPGEATHLYRVWTSGGLAALTSGAGDYACPSVSPDGTRVMFWHGTAVKNLMVADGLSDGALRAIGEDEYHLWPALSPSGSHVASVVRRPSYEEHLYVTEIPSGRSVELSSRPARHPAWVDETSVAYLEQAGPKQADVWLVNIAAAMSPIKLTGFRGVATWVAVHPGKTAVAVVLTDDAGRQRIVLRKIDGHGADRTVAEGGEYEHLRWTPDGSMLSWSGPERSSDPNSNGIWVADPERPPARRILADGYGPVWAPDGNVVYYSRIREFAGLWQYDLRAGQASRLRDWPEGYHEFDIVGDRLVVTEEAGRGRVFTMLLDP